MVLKYLFEAEFKDGAVMKQSADDVSKIDPLRSQFYDVLNYGFPVVKFYLKGNGHTLAVDLLDGHFESDGNVFFVGNNAPESVERELVFYRQHTHNFNQNMEDMSDHVRYFLGWKDMKIATDDKVIVGID